jgi:hypothetical protein
MWPRFNEEARQFAEKYRLAGTVGSDAHAAFELGRSLMVLEPFEDSEGLRAVIRRGIPQVKWSPPWVHLTSRYAVLYKTLKGYNGLDMT